MKTSLTIWMISKSTEFFSNILDWSLLVLNYAYVIQFRCLIDVTFRPFEWSHSRYNRFYRRNFDVVASLVCLSSLEFPMCSKVNLAIVSVQNPSNILWHGFFLRYCYCGGSLYRNDCSSSQSTCYLEHCEGYEMGIHLTFRFCILFRF